METSLDQIKIQYEKYPYPKFPWIASLKPAGMAHASFETGASLIFQNSIREKGKRIALLGCGTFEPYAFGATHQDAQITAVDLSAKTLEMARRRCRIFLTRNVTFLKDDIVNFSKNSKETFDYIHCYGVLHHLARPIEGFKALAKLLNPNGFARIMVYSKSHRRKTELLRTAGKILQIDPTTPGSVSLFRKMVKSLPLTHPLRLVYELNPDRGFESGVVDAFLNACENPFDVTELKAVLGESGLFIHAWDFSRNLQNLIQTAQGSAIDEKLKMLESFDQWPSNYTFWVSKRAVIQKSQKVFIKKNPLVKITPFTKSVYSSLLRQEIQISDQHRILLNIAAQESVPKEYLAEESEFRLAFKELSDARFVLEVSS